MTYKIINSNKSGYECVDLNGKTIYISKKELETNAEFLDIDYDEAIQMWLEDEGYLENEEQEKLCKLAKENRITATIHKAGDPEKRRKRSPKGSVENVSKEAIIDHLYDFLEQIQGVSNVFIENKTKLITFEYDNKHFKLDLIQKREKKEK